MCFKIITSKLVLISCGITICWLSSVCQPHQELTIKLLRFEIIQQKWYFRLQILKSLWTIRKMLMNFYLNNEFREQFVPLQSQRGKVFKLKYLRTTGNKFYGTVYLQLVNCTFYVSFPQTFSWYFQSTFMLFS